MNWNQFLMILLGIYVAYYGMNLVFDLLQLGQKKDKGPDDDVLHFDEGEPALIIHDALADAAVASVAPSSGADEMLPEVSGTFSSGTVISTGAVSLKELFSLAKDDLIEYTKAISY